MSNKLQNILDDLHKGLASADATGKLAPFFQETYAIDHTAARSQTKTEVMIVEDILMDPLHIDTWFSTINGLMFSSPVKTTFKVEFYLLSQMGKELDITLKAPAAASMFPATFKLKDPNNQKLADVIKAQLSQPTVSQSGYLRVNPLFFWQMVEHTLPDDITPSATNPDFIDFVNRWINELMLHEVNHHLNGHTVFSIPSYSPLKPQLANEYAQHTFALGQFKAHSEHELANILEDFGINDYLNKFMRWSSNTPSLFTTGVASLNPAVEQGAHGISVQPSVTARELTDINISIFDRYQAFTDSDIQVENESGQSQSASQDESSESSESQDESQDESTLDEIVATLTQDISDNTDSDAHSASESASEINKEIAKAQLSNSLKDAQGATGSQPGMLGSDYTRALEPGTKAKPLPKLSVKLAKLRRQLNNKAAVNWSMPHQVLTDRLDIHRIEKQPAPAAINVWVDTSGSMSDEELNNLMTLIIANYVTSAKATPIIVHAVSVGAVGEPIELRSKNDLKKLTNLGLASNGGTDFDYVISQLEAGAHIILSDFEWMDTDVSNNIAVITNPNKKILWVNTYVSDSTVLTQLRALKQVVLNLSDYTY